MKDKTDSASEILEQSCHGILEAIGEDPNREGLLDTPKRFARAFKEITSGYHENIKEIVGRGVFKESCNEMILVRNIEFYSMCEHHLLPFFGSVHVAYIPNGKIIGLSKIPRIVKHFARRLQVQERLTSQISEALNEILAPQGVGCIIEARHMCMMMRGIQVQSGDMVTSAMLGSFLEDQKTRQEFVASINSTTIGR